MYQSRDRVRSVTGSLLTQTRAERAAIPALHPGRVDVIGAGALVLDRVMQRFGFAEVVVSEHDILDGIAWSLAREPRGAVLSGLRSEERATREDSTIRRPEGEP